MLETSRTTGTVGPNKIYLRNGNHTHHFPIDIEFRQNTELWNFLNRQMEENAEPKMEYPSIQASARAGEGVDVEIPTGEQMCNITRGVEARIIFRGLRHRDI